MTTKQTNHRQAAAWSKAHATLTALALPMLPMLLSLAIASCSDADETSPAAQGTVPVRLTIQTRAAEDNTAEEGTTWENYMDFTGGDYRIYFFTNTDTKEGGKEDKLIGEFQSVSVIYEAGTDYARYDITGNVVEDLTDYAAIKVVVLANWGKDNYPDVELTTTTIDNLCGQTFTAFVEDDGEGDKTATLPTTSRHIPFYGVQSYMGVTWKEGAQTHLTTPIDMLRAVAKVEVIADEGLEFTDVTMKGYNEKGYCAPTGMYTKTEEVTSPHLVNNGKNDTKATENAMRFAQQTDGTWVCYLAEYNNMSDDYSYITATATIEGNEESHQIYFASYNDKTTDAYEEGGNTSSRYNILRNYLYRFTVTRTTETTSTSTGVTTHTPTRSSAPATVAPTLTIKSEQIDLR